MAKCVLQFILVIWNMIFITGQFMHLWQSALQEIGFNALLLYSIHDMLGNVYPLVFNTMLWKLQCIQIGWYMSWPGPCRLCQHWLCKLAPWTVFDLESQKPGSATHPLLVCVRGTGCRNVEWSRTVEMKTKIPLHPHQTIHQSPNQITLNR